MSTPVHKCTKMFVVHEDGGFTSVYKGIERYYIGEEYRVANRAVPIYVNEIMGWYPCGYHAFDIPHDDHRLNSYEYVRCDVDLLDVHTKGKDHHQVPTFVGFGVRINAVVYVPPLAYVEGKYSSIRLRTRNEVLEILAANGVKKTC